MDQINMLKNNSKLITKPLNVIAENLMNEKTNKCSTNIKNNNKNKEERYSRVPRLSDTRYSAIGIEGKWRYASSKARLKCATYRR